LLKAIEAKDGSGNLPISNFLETFNRITIIKSLSEIKIKSFLRHNRPLDLF
jgi:hypothetical protein